MHLRISSRLLVGLLLLNLACGGPSDDDWVTPVSKFQVGEPITDGGIALIVDHGSSSDTLLTEALNANIDRLNNLFPEIMADPAQAVAIRREIVRQFVLERAMMVEAGSRGILVDSARVSQRIDAFRSQFPSDEAFGADLAERNMTREELDEQVLSELTRDALLEQVGQSVDPPDSTDVAAFIEKLGVRLKTQHILFMVEEGDDPKALRKLANAVLDSAQAGTDFSGLARRHSEDPGSAALGGELPHFRTGEMVGSFEDAAFALSESGEITPELVRTAYGYHIIRLVERLQDNPVDPDSAAQLLHEQLRREARTDYMDELLGRTVVRQNLAFIPDETVG